MLESLPSRSTGVTSFLGQMLGLIDITTGLIVSCGTLHVKAEPMNGFVLYATPPVGCGTFVNGSKALSNHQ